MNIEELPNIQICPVEFDFSKVYTQGRYFGKKICANGYVKELGKYSCDKYKTCPYYWTYTYIRLYKKKDIEEHPLFEKVKELIENNDLEKLLRGEKGEF